MVTIDVLFNLTPESRSPYAINILGWAFVMCIFTNLAVHLSFIVRNGCRDAKRSCKNKKYFKRYKIWYAALPDEKKKLHKTPEEVKEDMDEVPEEDRAAH